MDEFCYGIVSMQRVSNYLTQLNATEIVGLQVTTCFSLDMLIELLSSLSHY